MKLRLLNVAAILAVTLAAGVAHAQVPEYSFEVNDLFGRPDTFFGLGATVTQDTIGATHLQHSMKYAAGNDGFVGARTETIIPPTLGNPPGVNYVLFDMTIVDPYAGGFADIGVTVFGHALNAPGGAQFGHQVQFGDVEAIGGKAPGTYPDVRIDLSNSVGPYRAGESFNAIFGPDPTDLTVASAFQFFISKNAGVPATVYIDNVRLVVPEPASVGLAGFAGLALFGLRRRFGAC
jgi:hypothetical protein